jgi:hypothetical protein
MLLKSGKISDFGSKCCNLEHYPLEQHKYYFIRTLNSAVQMYIYTYYVYNTRVARWFVFKPESQIWVNFGGLLNGKCWYILWPFGIIFGRLLLFVVIWYIFPVLVRLVQEKSGNPVQHPNFLYGVNMYVTGIYPRFTRVFYSESPDTACRYVRI